MWSEEKAGRRTQHLCCNQEIGFDRECSLSDIIPAASIRNVDYTVVTCGYTSRIKLKSLPNAFCATDGLWGADQQAADAEGDIKVLNESGVPLNGSFIYRGLADLEHLMEFRHCGCFNNGNLYGVSMVEVHKAERPIRILQLTYDTESG